MNNIKTFSFSTENPTQEKYGYSASIFNNIVSNHEQKYLFQSSLKAMLNKNFENNDTLDVCNEINSTMSIEERRKIFFS